MHMNNHGGRSAHQLPIKPARIAALSHWPSVYTVLGCTALLHRARQDEAAAAPVPAQCPCPALPRNEHKTRAVSAVPPRAAARAPVVPTSCPHPVLK